MIYNPLTSRRMEIGYCHDGSSTKQSPAVLMKKAEVAPRIG